MSSTLGMLVLGHTVKAWVMMSRWSGPLQGLYIPFLVYLCDFSDFL